MAAGRPGSRIGQQPAISSGVAERYPAARWSPRLVEGHCGGGHVQVVAAARIGSCSGLLAACGQLGVAAAFDNCVGGAMSHGGESSSHTPPTVTAAARRACQGNRRQSSGRPRTSRSPLASHSYRVGSSSRFGHRAQNQWSALAVRSAPRARRPSTCHRSLLPHPRRRQSAPYLDCSAAPSTSRC